MNKTLFLITVGVLLLSGSCFKDPDIRFGFDTLFGSNSQGVSIMNVSSSVSTITLKGDVVITSGEVFVELTGPGDEPIFTRTLKSPASIHIDESYQAAPGNWKLRYNSNEGTGTLKLHLATGK